jgi:hypothetical protein
LWVCSIYPGNTLVAKSLFHYSSSSYVFYYAHVYCWRGVDCSFSPPGSISVLSVKLIF